MSSDPEAPQDAALGTPVGEPLEACAVEEPTKATEAAKEPSPAPARPPVWDPSQLLIVVFRTCSVFMVTLLLAAPAAWFAHVEAGLPPWLAGALALALALLLPALYAWRAASRSSEVRPPTIWILLEIPLGGLAVAGLTALGLSELPRGLLVIFAVLAGLFGSMFFVPFLGATHSLLCNRARFQAGLQHFVSRALGLSIGLGLGLMLLFGYLEAPIWPPLLAGLFAGVYIGLGWGRRGTGLLQTSPQSRLLGDTPWLTPGVRR